MEKIITLFARNYDGDCLVRDEVTPGAEWVLAGEGVATEKIDGTCCLVRAGKLYKRYELKANKYPPTNFEAATERDPVTGKIQGWVPVGDGPDDQWHREAFDAQAPPDFEYPDGTYELVGPKVQGNPYGYSRHALIIHGEEVLIDVSRPPRDYAGLRAYLTEHAIEGIVWWRNLDDPNCEKVKLKRKDFGLPWPVKEGC
jgi:hypothetical protein